MKIYLFVLITLLAVAGCSNSTAPAEDDSKSGTTDSSGTTESSPSDNEGSDPSGEKPSGSDAKANAEPKDAVKAFVDALKAKDANAVKSALSEKTNKMLALQEKMSGMSVVDVFSKDGFDGLPSEPETRNPKIDGEKATLEVKDKKDDKWSEIPLVKENGSWKLAFADADYDAKYEQMAAEVEKMMKDKKDVPKSTDGSDDKSKN